MNKQCILVVEDERLVARDIAMRLKELGYETLGPAGTAEEALELAARQRPDLVLMDTHLGSAMDGIAAALALRAQWGISCIFMSGFDIAEQLARAQQAEPVGYLEKPFEEYELRNMVAAALQNDNIR